MHTLYEWCFINNIRPLDIMFGLNPADDDEYMTKEIGLAEFKEYLKNGKYKENSLPRKPEKYLELRMYGLVPYNISEIQKGIQFGHAVARYGRKHNGSELSEYIRWVDNWETFIILNGGTSNEGHLVTQGFNSSTYHGTMQQHLTELTVNNIRVASFYEPDLNSMLSAMCFIVDERVFNKELYPDYKSSPLDKDATISEFNKWSENDTAQYAKWVEKIGGDKNLFLRNFLSGKRLA